MIFKLNNLNTAQKIGQVIMPRIDFGDPDSLPMARTLLKDYQVGGFIIFNAVSEFVIEATSELQELSDIPLFFACDGERGVGQIVKDMERFPFNMSIGAIGDEDLVYEQASFIAHQMKDCGLNLLFAPVCDVNSNPNNPIINIRSYGDDPELVSRLCSAFVKGCQDNGVLACAKHFPGHGRTGVDSHIDLPVLDTELETLEKIDLVPFQAAIEAGVASIMTAHIGFSQIGDGSPATVSNELISGVLRDKMGYEGLVVTDSLHMEGIIKLGKEYDISTRALNAGADIILDPLNPMELVSNLATLEPNHLGLDTKVERILNIKEKWLTNNAANKVSEIDAIKLKERIANESVCFVKGRPSDLDGVSICPFDVTNCESEIYIPFIEQMESHGVNVVVADDSSRFRITEDSTIICLVYTTIGAWKKQSTLPSRYISSLKYIGPLNCKTILVSFGSPYVVEGLDSFDTVLCSFDILDECQKAAADVLLGKISTKAKLPVSLK
ncbi:MAG: glycoside hydrolase family 3 N-terminal domain-containing protein [Thermodesulfobacteriota bacterium]